MRPHFSFSTIFLISDVEMEELFDLELDLDLPDLFILPTKDVKI